ncbi:uncharacterized protein LOC113517116 [Galleria mellonella]|uniref:Uncharacterized protein LOC113517116 n=1 Tax=Galleria mellonella TaxID=7137 RepID=A0A6J3BUM1_GALME|nr:uncharacterized protein LOC113517116 [Galleria mellonella]
MAELHILGQLQCASNFEESTSLFCRYTFQTGRVQYKFQAQIGQFYLDVQKDRLHQLIQITISQIFGLIHLTFIILQKEFRGGLN